MKHTRSAQYLWRLTKWRELYDDLRNMPIYCFEQEISIEDAKRMFPDLMLHGVAAKYTVHEPMEVAVDPITFSGLQYCIGDEEHPITTGSYAGIPRADWPRMPSIAEQFWDAHERLRRQAEILYGADPKLFKEKKS